MITTQPETRQNILHIFETFSKGIHDLLKTPVSIWYPDDKKQTLRMIVTQGIPATTKNQMVLQIDEPSVTSNVFTTGQSMMVENIQDPDSLWKYKEDAKKRGWVSALCAPIAAQGVVEGVLTVYAVETNRQYLPLMRHYIESTAAQIGLSIETEKHRQVTEALLSISQKYDSIPINLKSILNDILTTICSFTGADCAVVYPFDADREDFYDSENVLAYGTLNKLDPSDKPRSGPNSMASYVKDNDEVVVNDILREDEALFESGFIQREGIKAFMAIAPKAAGEALGVLYVNFRSPHPFTDDEKSTIRLFAHQAGIAINNAHLYERSNKQNLALKELHEVGREIVSIPSKKGGLRAVLDKIAIGAHKALGADLVDLYHYNEEDDRFTLPPSLAGDRSGHSNTTIQPDDVANKIVKEKQALFIVDSQKDTRTNSPLDPNRTGQTTTQLRFVQRERIRSTAAIPLLVEGKVVGVLFINYRSRQTFPQHQRELIHVFATEAAVAIANVSLYESSQKRSEALSRLNKVAENLVKLSEGSANLNELLQQIADGAKDVLGADLVDLYQYQQSLDHYPLPIIQVGDRFKSVKKDKIFKDDVVCMVVESNHAWYVEDAITSESLRKPYEQRSDKPDERFVVRENIQSMAALPMKIGSEIVGVLFVSYREKQNFSAAQRELIELFAAQAGIAIRNARLLLRRQALLEFGNAISSDVDLQEDEILNLVHDKAAGLMNTSNMYIALYDREPDVVRFGLVYVNGTRISPAEDPRWQPRKAGKGRTEEIIRTQKPILIKTMQESLDWYKGPGRQEYVGTVFASWLGVAMVASDKVLGVVATYHPEREGVYSDDDLVMMQTIANQAAIALENARSYIKIEKNLQAIVKFGEAITISEKRLTEQDVLNLVRTQIGSLMNCESMYVAQYDSSNQRIRFGLAYEGGNQVEYPDRKADFAKRGLTEEIIQTKKPIFISTESEMQAWYKLPDHQEFVGKVSASWLGVPILLGQDVLGAIAVFNPEKEYLYTSDDLFILHAIANQAAIALDNSHQYYVIEENLRDLVKFGQKISKDIHLDRKDFLEEIRTEAAKFLDANNMYIALKSKKGSKEFVRFELVYRDGKPTQWEDRDINVGRTGEIFRTGQPIFLPTRKDVQEWHEQHPESVEHDQPSASWVGVPMLLGEEVIGVIGVNNFVAEKQYNGEDLELLRALANITAIALENARLYAEARDEVVAGKQLSAIGRATAAIEHRLNNTLNIIVPNLNRLRKRVDMNDAEIIEIIDIIDRNTRYTSDLLRRLHSSLLGAEKTATVDINATLAEIFENSSHEWNSDRTHSLLNSGLELDEAIPTVQLPLGQITEVFKNLIQNAFRELNKAYPKNTTNPAQGKILVFTKLEGDTINIRVKDNVPGGIPAAIRLRLFEKPVPSKTPGEGSGLGLWLSRLILESIGGSIEIENSGQLGTTFLVKIPAKSR